MVERIPQRCLLLILILICISFTLSNSNPANCSRYLDTFLCKIKVRSCSVKVLNAKADCYNYAFVNKPGGTFRYEISGKSGKVIADCEGCCCHNVSGDSNSYQSVCPNCVTLWTKRMGNGTFIFSGSEPVMKEAINHKQFLKIQDKNYFPNPVVLCPDERKTKCQLYSNMTENWTIVGSNENWNDYFEESIVNGFIRVKKPMDSIKIKLAIQRKDINATRIHFLDVSVNNKIVCGSCFKPEEFTTLPSMSSPEPSTETQTIDDNGTTNAIHTSSPTTSQTSRITERISSSSLPFINSSSDFISPSIDSIQIVPLKDGFPNALNDEKNLEKELNSTGNETSKRIRVVAGFVKKHGELKEDNLAVAVKELNKVKEVNITENMTKDFTEVVDKVVSTKNMNSWGKIPQQKSRPSSILSATETYLKGATRYMKVGIEKKINQKDNIILHYGRVTKRRAHILYSYQTPWATIRIPRQVLQTAKENIRYSFVYYKSLSIVMKNVATTWNDKESQSERLNSPILSISLYPRLRYPLKKNINFTLKHNKRSNSRLICAYWNFSYKTHLTGYYGRWETDGCYVASQNQTCTTCSCNHLTNFALLMNIHPKFEDTHLTTVMSLISGSISSLSLLITIACYAILWPNITQNPVNKSRAIILMNLCVALLTANIIFLAGSNQYANKVACKAISVLLHYFYLAVFFSMLMEGLDMFITVILVFSKKIKAKWFILGTWIFPLLIVGISLPIQFDNYSGPNHCWLSVRGGLRWAFLGPVFFIIFINTIILIVVISRMLQTREMMQKTVKERVRTGARGIALLSPVLGFTWSFLITENPISQYIFITCYSLQGVFIFLLHCLFSRQVREGFCQWLHKKSYFNELSNSTLKCAVMDQTNVTRTMSTAQSLDDLDSYQHKMSEFQPRKSVDLLIPGN